MRVFLSYHEDEKGDECAQVLREELAILGIDATMAKHSIKPGASWAQGNRTRHTGPLGALRQ